MYGKTDGERRTWEQIDAFCCAVGRKKHGAMDDQRASTGIKLVLRGLLEGAMDRYPVSQSEGNHVQRG